MLPLKNILFAIHCLWLFLRCKKIVWIQKEKKLWGTCHPKNATLFYVSMHRSEKYIAYLQFTWLATEFLPPCSIPEFCLLYDVCPFCACAFHLPIVPLGCPLLEEGLAITLASRACFNHRLFFADQYKQTAIVTHPWPSTGSWDHLQPLELWLRQSGTVLQASRWPAYQRGPLMATFLLQWTDQMEGLCWEMSPRTWWKCKKKLLYCENTWTLNQVIRRSYGVSILGDTQNTIGYDPEHSHPPMPVFSKDFGLDDLQSSLSASAALWFCSLQMP